MDDDLVKSHQDGWQSKKLSRVWRDKARNPAPGGTDGLFTKPSWMKRIRPESFKVPQNGKGIIGDELACPTPNGP